MKTTLLIQPGIKQLVLTPESESEKSIFEMFPDGIQLSVKRGSFFHKCEGGWVREYPNNDSLILIMKDNNEHQHLPS